MRCKIINIHPTDNWFDLYNIILGSSGDFNVTGIYTEEDNGTFFSGKFVYDNPVFDTKGKTKYTYNIFSGIIVSDEKGNVLVDELCSHLMYGAERCSDNDPYIEEEYDEDENNDNEPEEDGIPF